MKVTVLIENTAQPPLKCEHGLSMHIEFQGKNYLLDAGTTEAFMKNAEQLGIGLTDIEACILSHGHYDHSGGFGIYLKENQIAKVYMMENADGDYYSGSGGLHYIGIPKNIVEEHKHRFVTISDVTKIAENMYLVPHHTKGLEKIGERANLYVKKGDAYIPDDFRHELSLVFDTEKGLVIFNSCSHGGIQNIVREVTEVFPEKEVYAFLGGLHMKGKRDGKDICTFSEEEIQLLIADMEEKGLKYLYTGHCTGIPGYELLKKYAGDRVQALTTGKIIEL